MGFGVINRGGTENIESMLRRFKKFLKMEDQFKELRKHDFFLKKSDKRKLKRRRRKFTDGTGFMG